jgi:hypothetical protein
MNNLPRPPAETRKEIKATNLAFSMTTQAGAEAATGPREQLYAFLVSKGWEWNGYDWVRMPPVSPQTGCAYDDVERFFRMKYDEELFLVRLHLQPHTPETQNDVMRLIRQRLVENLAIDYIWSNEWLVVLVSNSVKAHWIRGEVQRIYPDINSEVQETTSGAWWYMKAMS